MIVNLYRHRGYIWRNALADVRNRYVGSTMGIVWNILQPLLLIAVMAVVFSKIMHRPDRDSVPYIVYLCSAMLPWFAFAECLNRGTQSFVANAAYLRRLPIPEQVFVAQTALSTAIGLVISYALLIIVALSFGHAPSWHWLLLPIPLGLLITLGFGIGLALGTVNAFIRDVGQIVPVLVQVGFWSFPIVYNSDQVPRLMQKVLPFNPVYPCLQGIRELFLARQVPDLSLWLMMAAWALVACAGGYLVLRKLRPELRDVI